MLYSESYIYLIYIGKVDRKVDVSKIIIIKEIHNYFCIWFEIIWYILVGVGRFLYDQIQVNEISYTTCWVMLRYKN